MDALWSDSIGSWSEPAPSTARRSRHRAALDDTDPGPQPSVDGDDAERKAGAATDVEAPAPLPVEVIRSPKRRKSSSARIVDGRIVVRVPQWLSQPQVDEAVRSLVARLERQRTSTQVDLTERARTLARRYDLPEPDRIRWVANQQSRWGSCTPANREVRISDRIAGFPAWVVDAVVVHELAHLVHADHSQAFWALANRYPKTERALGFLIAKGMSEDGDDGAQP